MARLETRRIDIDELRVIGGLDAGDAVPRGLRLARGDADLGADQLVHERRFTDVGAADDGDVTASKVGLRVGFSHAIFVWEEVVAVAAAVSGSPPWLAAGAIRLCWRSSLTAAGSSVTVGVLPTARLSAAGSVLAAAFPSPRDLGAGLARSSAG